MTEIDDIKRRAGIREQEDMKYMVKFLGSEATPSMRPHLFTGYQQQVMEEIDDILSRGENFKQIIIQPARR